ncbi:uncharacterized protein LOC112051690 [Bicyclus anynana]|uniref:Uncharacterized protein LOC112051690 n=1 Tax=Bicyclus anynana TaxID=110368 RepID=A0A6J1NMR5_BICAN|nr:uncharacterized protein LOC112051690 [Bicyclus anynana]
MSEAESLILAVEKHPCLWDIHHKDYHNRDVKYLAWEQVSKDVIKDWDTCSIIDKENKGADLKKKWTHIRDYFRRDFKKNQSAPTGSAAKKVKKYVYANLLHFLIPVFDKRNTEAKYPISDDDNNHSHSWESETEEEEGVEDVNDHKYTIIKPPSPVMQPCTVQSPSTLLNKDDISTQILSILQQKANQKQLEVEDDDTKFLLSFRTHMKQMKENQKIEFKLGMLQLLKKINNEYSSSSLLN